MTASLITTPAIGHANKLFYNTGVGPKHFLLATLVARLGLWLALSLAAPAAGVGGSANGKGKGRDRGNGKDNGKDIGNGNGNGKGVWLLVMLCGLLGSRLWNTARFVRTGVSCITIAGLSLASSF